MAAMDVVNRRPQLPALAYLDVEKGKREDDAYSSRNAGPLHTLPPVAAASPPYSTGSSPPYSHLLPNAHAPSSWPPVHSGMHTPPESRRTSGEELDGGEVKRQSLPSISEALGVDSQASYRSSPPAPAAAASSHQTTPTLVSPTRPYAMDPPPPPPAQQPYAGNSAYHPASYPAPHPEPPAQQPYASQEPPRPSYAPDRRSPHLQALEQSSRVPHPPAAYTYPPSTSPGYEQPPSQPAGATAPQGFPYGYTSYPPRYSQAPPPSNAPGGPIYQPSATYPAPPTPSWKSEGTWYGPDDHSHSPGDYGTSVKRHLELYDFEGALNDIAQTSGIMADFSRRYGDRLHQTARSTPLVNTLPGLIEIDDMITKSRLQVESLMKIREVRIAQQAAFEQQLADQRQQHKSFSESPVHAHPHDADEPKGGFANGDSKKRRGRAAPPGRCHSCNRAETPEWRRGPDGARTLCNACGLHYAKLTRKQQGGNKNSSVASSNLRPKEN